MYDGHKLDLRTKGGRRKCSWCGLNMVPATASGSLLLTVWYRGAKLVGTDLKCTGKKGD